MNNRAVNEIIICMGSSCFSRGNKKNLEVIQAALKEKSLDAEFTFKGSHCLKECEQGPVLIVNGNKITKLTADDAAGILERCLNT